MSKDDYIQDTGTVVTEMGNARFTVHADEMNIDVICTISGKINKHSIRIMEKDRVSLDISTYDPTKGRITYRYKR
jgi:translation initiation factor IF-1